MSKVKIEIPEEFNIFLENALNVLKEYKEQERDIGHILNDMAKFRYYLRGRLHELEDLTKRKLSKTFSEYLIDKIGEINKINKNITLIFDTLAIIDNDVDS